MFQTEPPDLMHKRTRCTRIRIRTWMHSDATQADREKLNRGKSPKN
nr:MAG TPA: hypothetical protein [Caudoviricetes sp.]